MITVSATDLLRLVDATLAQKIDPALDDTGARSALTTVRHLLRFVRVRIEQEGQTLTREIAATGTLLEAVAAYHDGAGDGPAAEPIRATLAAVSPHDPTCYLSLDDLTAVTARLREALHHALAHLQTLRPARGDDPHYRAIRAAIRQQVIGQIEAEGNLVAPAFFGRGPRR